MSQEDEGVAETIIVSKGLICGSKLDKNIFQGCKLVIKVSM